MEGHMPDRDAMQLLNGLRVVELSRDLAAPLCGLLLGEQGAEVIRVVDPMSPPVDPVLDALFARGKLELALDPRRPEAHAMLHRLLRQADVVVQDGPGDPRLDTELLRSEHNPGLVSCTLPAFPNEDPRARLPGYEAFAGSAGYLYTRPLGLPRYHTFPIASMTAGLYAACGIMAALVARGRLGRGQHVEVPASHAACTAQVLQLLVKTGIPRGFLPLKMIGSPFMRCWLCQDNRHVYLHITMPTHNEQMLQILETSGFIEPVRRLRRVMSEETRRDPSQVKSIEEAKQIKAIYTEVFRSRPADAWEELLGRTLCCIKVRTVEEWLQDSLKAGMTDACEVEDPALGTLLGPGPLVASPDHPPIVAPRRTEPGLAPEALRRWESDPRPGPGSASIEPGATDAARPLAHALSGLRVLDLSRVIAGPCAARVLAEFGAEVLSLQSDTRLPWALSFHLLFNAGKRSATLDFRDEAGKARLHRVIDAFRPDALIQNYRHLDLARAIGVGPEAMRERYPDLVYTHLNAYGDHGIWQDRPGFEQVVQAVSGMQLAYAEGGRPKLLPSPIIDIGCGLLGAFGTLCGLYHRSLGHGGSLVTTHLTSVSVLLQIHRVSASQQEACLERARTRGLELRFDRDREVVAGLVRTLDARVCLAGPRRDLRRWMEHAGLLTEADIDEGQELERLGRRLVRRTLAHWQRSLIEAGVQDRVGLMPYPAIRRAVEDMRKTDPRPEPLIRRRAYPGSPRELTFVKSPVRLSLTPLCDIAPPPQRGADTRAVLEAAGLDVPAGSGPIPYPPPRSLPVWLASFLRWGYFAWKSGNI